MAQWQLSNYLYKYVKESAGGYFKQNTIFPKNCLVVSVFEGNYSKDVSAWEDKTLKFTITLSFRIPQ